MTIAATHVKTTQDGRKVEVIDGWICLAGTREADGLVPLAQHPNREAILRAVPAATHVAGRLPLTQEEAARAQEALEASRHAFTASPAGVAQRMRDAVWRKTLAEGVE